MFDYNPNKRNILEFLVIMEQMKNTVHVLSNAEKIYHGYTGSRHLTDIKKEDTNDTTHPDMMLQTKYQIYRTYTRHEIVDKNNGRTGVRTNVRR